MACDVEDIDWRTFEVPHFDHVKLKQALEARGKSGLDLTRASGITNGPVYTLLGGIKLGPIQRMRILGGCQELGIPIGEVILQREGAKAKSMAS